MASDSGWSSSDSSSGSERSSKCKLKKMDKHHKKETRDEERKERKERKAKEKVERKQKKEEERLEKKDQRNKEKYWKHHHQDAPGGGTSAEYSSLTPMFPSGAPEPPPYASSPGFSKVDNTTTNPSQSALQPTSIDLPPSGFRIPLRTDSDFAPRNQTGPPVAFDSDGSPIFIGSALFETSVHPCKIGPRLRPHALVPYGGTEHGHNGRYDLLPFVPGQMEWVHTSHGQVPYGRRPIEGGYEEDGGKLYHALAHVNGVRVPGKTGLHLKGANISFGGQELVHQEYEILCWK